MVIRVGVAVRLVGPRSFEYDLSTAASRLRGSRWRVPQEHRN
jgi:hypothetical protein